jgi:hypothetical protein
MVRGITEVKFGACAKIEIRSPACRGRLLTDEISVRRHQGSGPGLSATLA